MLALTIIAGGSALPGTGASAVVSTGPELTVQGSETARVGERMEYLVYFNPTAEDPTPRISVASNVAGCRREPFTPEVVTGFVTIDCGRRAAETDAPSYTAWFRVTFEDGSTSTKRFTTTVSRRQQPDVMVRRGSGAFVGDDVFTRPTTQMVTGTLRRGKAVTFTFRVQNDGPLRDKFQIDADPYSSVGNETWRFGGEDITDEIASTFVYTRWLEPGEHADLKLTLTRWRWADLGDVGMQRVGFESWLDASRTDTVAIRVTVGDERR